MVIDPDLTEIAVEGFNAALETSVGDKCLHFASNPKQWKRRSDTKTSSESTSRSDRRPASNSSGSRRDGSDHSEKDRRRRSQREQGDYRGSHEQKGSDASDWSRKSYWQSKPHQQQRQSPDEPRARQSQASSSDEWSKKSYLQSRRHQQQQQQDSNTQPRRVAEKILENQLSKDTNSQTARLADPRHDSFRLAKSAYMPPPPSSSSSSSAPQNVPRMMWNEEKLYGDVGRAVQEAMRRSAELGRAR